MKDALAFGGMCISLLNHADRVKCACLAQLVNAIAPILTETGGPAWRQTIFWPFADFANLGHGTVLKGRVESPAYDCVYADPRGATMLEFPMSGVSYLKAAAVHSAKDQMLTLFLLNRSLDDPMSVSVTASGLGNLVPGAATTLCNDDLEAVNTKDAAPVAPVPLGGIAATDGGVRISLPAASWNVVRLNVT
jgi:alpha-N-arabinofuranosidase